MFVHEMLSLIDPPLGGHRSEVSLTRFGPAPGKQVLSKPPESCNTREATTPNITLNPPRLKSALFIRLRKNPISFGFSILKFLIPTGGSS